VRVSTSGVHGFNLDLHRVRAQWLDESAPVLAHLAEGNPDPSNGLGEFHVANDPHIEREMAGEEGYELWRVRVVLAVVDEQGYTEHSFALIKANGERMRNATAIRLPKSCEL